MIKSQLEKDLEEVARRWSGLEAPEPPDLIDQAVLNAARRAVDRRPTAPWRRPRWLGAIATASVVVLTLAIVARQDGHAPQPRGDTIDTNAVAPPPLEQSSGEVTRSNPATAAARTAAPSVQAETMAAPPAEHRPTVAAPRESEQDATMEPERKIRLEERAVSGSTARQLQKASRDRDESGFAEQQAEPADAWFERLRALKASGPPERFQAELKLFRRTYPDYPVPADWLK